MHTIMTSVGYIEARPTICCILNVVCLFFYSELNVVLNY